MPEKRRLYLDNAATSFPKPPQVLEAMCDYASRLGASAGRGAYAEALETGEMLQSCRREINALINGADPRQVVFALNCTDALNIALRGLIDPAEPGHVVCSEADHNSILRPIHAMAEQFGLEFTAVAVDPGTTLVDPQEIRRAIRPDTRYVALTHASNVTGAVQPLAGIGAICREMEVPLVVDAAQSLGHIELDVAAEHVDLLAAPGHKGLLGPLGTGFLYLRPGLERQVRPLREGGTGSRSETPTMPTHMPDRYEPGSHNAIGIAGLLAGVRWLRQRGVATIAEHERRLAETFLQAVNGLEGLQIHGRGAAASLKPDSASAAGARIGVFSIQLNGLAPQELSAILESGFGILSRSGIHCAPFVHRALGTLESGGTTRLSFGPFVTEEDVRYVAEALGQVMAGMPS